MSNLVDHAKRELALAGNDDDFNESIIKAVEGFVSYDGHSGTSAEVAASMIYDILRYRNITSLTDDPKEWMQVDFGDETPCWQSLRNPAAFSLDNGRNYYLLYEGANQANPKPMRESKKTGIWTGEV